MGSENGKNGWAIFFVTCLASKLGCGCGAVEFSKWMSQFFRWLPGQPRVWGQKVLKMDEPTLPSLPQTLKERSWFFHLVTRHLLVKLEILNYRE